MSEAGAIGLPVAFAAGLVPFLSSRFPPRVLAAMSGAADR